jgi:hypothetical protein
MVAATHELEIFGRLIRDDARPMPASLARYVIGLDFPAADKQRMRQLAVQNEEDALKPREKAELAAWVKAGHLLAALQSKARQSLKVKRRPNRG